MNPLVTYMLAHNPGGQPIIPVPILVAIPLVCLALMVVFILKKRYGKAAIAFLTAVATAFAGVALIVDAVV